MHEIFLSQTYFILRYFLENQYQLTTGYVDIVYTYVKRETQVFQRIIGYSIFSSCIN